VIDNTTRPPSPSTITGKDSLAPGAAARGPSTGSSCWTARCSSWSARWSAAARPTRAGRQGTKPMRGPAYASSRASAGIRRRASDLPSTHGGFATRQAAAEGRRW